MLVESCVVYFNNESTAAEEDKKEKKKRKQSRRSKKKNKKEEEEEQEKAGGKRTKQQKKEEKKKAKAEQENELGEEEEEEEEVSTPAKRQQLLRTKLEAAKEELRKRLQLLVPAAAADQPAIKRLHAEVVRAAAIADAAVRVRNVARCFKASLRASADTDDVATATEKLRRVGESLRPTRTCAVENKLAMETANLKAAKVYEAAQNEASEQLALAEKAAADAVYQWWIASTLEKLARTATTEAVDSNSEQQKQKKRQRKKKQQQPKEAPLVTILKQLLKRAQRLLTTTEQEISGLKKRQAQYAAKELASNPIRRCYSTDLPSVRSGAYQALMNNFASNVAKLKKNGVGHFDLHYMTLKDRQTSFEIAWQNWQSNSETCVWTKLRNPGLWRVDRFRPPDDSDSKGQRRKQQRKTRTLPDANSLAYAHHDPRLLLTRDGEFYVVLRYKVKTNKRASETQARALRVVILDLGTRRVASALDLGKERLVI